MLFTYIIKQDGIEKAKFEDQQNDFKAFGFLLRNQGQSVHYALTYAGWSITEINQQTGEVSDWNPYKKAK